MTCVEDPPHREQDEHEEGHQRAPGAGRDALGWGHLCDEARDHRGAALAHHLTSGASAALCGEHRAEVSACEGDHAAQGQREEAVEAVGDRLDED